MSKDQFSPKGNILQPVNTTTTKLPFIALYDFFVEVWYFPLENRIVDIQVVTDDKTFNHYIDNQLKFSNE
jgi:hypothetical protein